MTTEDIFMPIARLDELKDRIGSMRKRLDEIELELEEEL